MGNEKGMIETDVISWSSEHFHGGLVYLLYGKSSFNSSVVQIFEQTGPSPGDASLWHGCRPCVLDVIFRGLGSSEEVVFGPLRCLQSLFGRRRPLFPTAHKEETALTNALKAQRKLSLICSLLACVESCIKSSLRMLFPLLPNPIFWARDQGWWCCNRIYFCQLCQDPSSTLSLTRIEGVVKELNFLRMDMNLMEIVTFNVQNPPTAQGGQMNAILK